MKDDLERLADEVDKVADEHEGHIDCLTTPLMRAVGSAIREIAATRGPAQVSTSAYRDGWANIFGKKQPVGRA
jgi:hypothetical protein